MAEARQALARAAAACMPGAAWHSEGTQTLPDNITSVLDGLEEQTRDATIVRVADILEAFSGRLFGPLLLLPALIVISPLGVIPLVPTAMAVLLALISGQGLLGRGQPWVPRQLRERSVERERLQHAFSRLRPWTQRIDRLTRPRLEVLVTGPMQPVLILIVLLLAGVMVPLEVLPFAAALPALSIALLAIAMLGQDGLLGALGFAAGGGSLVTLFYLLAGG